MKKIDKERHGDYCLCSNYWLSFLTSHAMDVQDSEAETSAATKRQRIEPGVEQMLLPTTGKRRRGRPCKNLHATNKTNVEERAPPLIGHGFPNSMKCLLLSLHQKVDFLTQHLVECRELETREPTSCINLEKIETSYGNPILVPYQ